jgi:hypothetical protein
LCGLHRSSTRAGGERLPHALDGQPPLPTRAPRGEAGARRPEARSIRVRVAEVPDRHARDSASRTFGAARSPSRRRTTTRTSAGYAAHLSLRHSRSWASDTSSKPLTPPSLATPWDAVHSQVVARQAACRDRDPAQPRRRTRATVPRSCV